MSYQQSDSSRLVHHMARLSYLADMMAQRRVLIIGNDFEFAQFISGARARHVIAVADRPSDLPWPERSSTPGVEFQSMDLNQLKFRDASFDMAVLPDLTTLPNPSVALGEIYRVLGHQGQAMIGSPNPSCELRLGTAPEQPHIDYYQLYDLLSEVFPNVQMIGQSPFVGYTVADLSAGDQELEIRFDDSLLEDETEEIEWFLAVCGSNASEISPYSIIQIPLSEVSVGGAESGESQRGDDLAAEIDELKKSLQEAKLELGTRGVRIESLEKDLENELRQSEAARARAVRVAKELDEEKKASQRRSIEEEYSKRSQDMELQSSVKDLTVQMKQAEERANAAEASRDDLVDRMRADAADLERLRDRLAAIDEESNQSLAEKRALKGELQNLQGKLNTLSLQLRQAEERAQTAEASRDDFVDRMRADAAELEQLRNKLEGAETTAAAETVKSSSLEKEIQDLQTALRKAEEKAAAAEAAAAAAAEAAAAAVPDRSSLKEEDDRNTEIFSAEIANLEKRLEEKAGALKIAKQEVARHEAISRDLIVALENKESVVQEQGKQLGEPDATPEHNQKIAELEGLLQAAKWKAEELEARTQDMQRLVEEKNIKVKNLEREMESIDRETHGTDATASYQQELEARERNARMFEEEAKQQTERATYLQQSLDEARERVGKLEQHLEEASKNQTRFESELGNMSQRSQEAHRLAQEAEARAAKTLEQLEDASASLQASNAELDGAHAQIISLQAAVQEAETTVRHELAQELEEASRLSKRIADLENQIEETEGNLAEERDRSEKLLRTIDTMRTAEETNADQSAKTNAEFDQLRAQLTQREQAFVERNQQLETTEGLLKSLREEMSEVWTQKEQLQTSLNEERDRNNALEEEIDHLRSTAGETQDLVSDMQHAKADAERREKALAESSQRVAELEAELQKTATRADNLQNGLEEAKRQVDMLKGELGDSSKIAVEIEQERDSAKEHTSELLGELNEAKERIQSLENALEDKSQKASTHQAELAEIEKEKLAIDKKLKESEALRNQLDAAVDASKTLVDDMRRELNQARTRATELEADAIAAKEQDDMVAKLQSDLQSTTTRIAELESAETAWQKEAETAAQLKEELQTATERVRELEQIAAAAEKDSSLVAQLQIDLQMAEANLAQAQEQVASAAEPGADTGALQETVQEQEKLLESLTSQLEEREQRANRLERQIRELGTQIKEHESDIVAWEMELKFRNTRISQLETENEKLQQDMAAEPQKPGPPPPPLPQGAPGADSSPDDNPDVLRSKLGQLNEALGDKDAELLILHGQIEDSKRRMEYTRNILENIVRENKVDSETAQQFSDLVQAMK